MSKITERSLFVINQVRFRRFILGVSSRKLSELLEHSTSYVGRIDSQATQDQYASHEYPKLAEALKCTVQDFLPSDDIKQKSTSALVDKVVLSLSNQADLKLLMDGLIASGFFDRPKTMDDVAKHLFMEKKEQVDLLFEVLEGIVKAGTLKRRLLDYYRDIV